MLFKTSRAVKAVLLQCYFIQSVGKTRRVYTPLHASRCHNRINTATILPVVPVRRAYSTGCLVLISSSAVMSKTALVILPQGAEEMETVITVDMLRRGGVTVTLAGLDSDAPVLCSRLVTLVPNKSLADALAENPQYDAVILPGGLEGSERLSKSAIVGTLLKEHEKAGKIVAAICAAPTAFVAHGVAKGKRVTSYPTTKEQITGDYKYVEGERVVVDGNIVTSRGPGTAYWFGLALIEQLTGKEEAAKVEKGMIITGY